MRRILYLLCMLLGTSAFAQTAKFERKLEFVFTILQKETKTLMPGSIVEVFSGDKRIDVGISDYSGRQFAYLNPKDIIDNKILIKVYGIKCKPHEQTMIVKQDLAKTIYLSYGNTEYTKASDIGKLMKKFNFPAPPPFFCGTVD